MGYRLSKIYTRKGDKGTTSLDGRTRLPKDHDRVNALGNIDELNSAIGLVLSFTSENDIKKILIEIQQNLFNLGGELCPPFHLVIDAEKVTELENILDTWNKQLPPLKEFLLPGGPPSAAACHLARTICRRAERSLVTLNKNETLNPEILRYMNRLSDVLFVAARILAKDAGAAEEMWEHER